MAGQGELERRDLPGDEVEEARDFATGKQTSDRNIEDTTGETGELEARDLSDDEIEEARDFSGGKGASPGSSREG
ncbi:MAG: hypothetical protein M3220_21975 [Chloroflexota bacterium]|nr:hypothetical protein [Chloroflexota bacterium]